MNQEQLTSLVRTAIKSVGAALIAHGATKTAQWLNTEDVIGAVILIAGLVWSHFHHADANLPIQKP